ncbi:MAG: hypothetical protein ACRCZB_04210 [Bacteroidales bacterium]
MKTKCYSVRLQSLVRISDKAFRATSFDGSSDILPASQVFGTDYDVQKSDAYWISAWILEKKDLQFSYKKEAWFDENGKMCPSYKVVTHTPKKIDPVGSNEIADLKK